MLATPLLLAIFLGGLFLFALGLNSKVSRIGEIMMFCGLLAICFMLAGHMLKLLRAG